VGADALLVVAVAVTAAADAADAQAWAGAEEQTPKGAALALAGRPSMDVVAVPAEGAAR